MAAFNNYNQEMAERVCELIATNPKGLHPICAENPDLPTPRTIGRWLIKYPEFKAMYGEARIQQAELLAYEMLQIADSISEYQIIGDKEDRAINAARVKNMIDARKFMAMKLYPKVYGNNQIISGNPDAPLVTLPSIVQALDGATSGLPEIKE